jgi:MoaA/NifB/PqqE/SkfB family radical SAM enzyme
MTVPLAQNLVPKVLMEAIDAGISSDIIRSLALRKAERSAYEHFVVRNRDNGPHQAQLDKYQTVVNMFRALDRAIHEGHVSRNVRRCLVRILVGKIMMGKDERRAPFREKYGFEPPGFVTISPAMQCNLRCEGCYATSHPGKKANLDYDIVHRVVNEIRESWGAHFCVISGGEPFLWRSQGKGIMDLFRENPDTFFLMYTNGTLIDEEMAAQLAEVGNVTPAISVEGFEKETDERRGKGVFQKIVRAMENLRRAGVPFGISATATRHNAELLVSDEFVDFYFEEQGAIYGWIFHYMPIGRHYTTELMITPEQRRYLWEREQYLVHERKIFLADFWNSGPVAGGCISAGRGGGYFYINWNGDVTPCVFFPYSTHNIVEVYNSGGDLTTILLSPMFQAIRAWQRAYGYGKPPSEVKNQIAPCAIRDHYKMAYRVIRKFGAKPIDEDAAAALEDPDYRRKMIEYGKAVEAITGPIWEERYVGPERQAASLAA